MAKSMTGFGAAHRDAGALRVSVEARTVNGRFLKISYRLPASLQAWESRMDRLVKDRIQRGTVSVTVHLRRTDPQAMVGLNEELVVAYQAAFRRLGLCEDTIPLLKGVLGTPEPDSLPEAEAQEVEATMAQALDELVQMREQEGAALVTVLKETLDRVDGLARQVRQRAPMVVVEYQERLRERLERLLEGQVVSVDPQQLAREVAVFADRSDITEELDRLRSHVVQAQERLTRSDPVGKTLDFLSQEMLREVNTIGSKSVDATLSTVVVQLKTEIERMKEQVANVE